MFSNYYIPISGPTYIELSLQQFHWQHQDWILYSHKQFFHERWASFKLFQQEIEIAQAFSERKKHRDHYVCISPKQWVHGTDCWPIVPCSSQQHSLVWCLGFFPVRTVQRGMGPRKWAEIFWHPLILIYVPVHIFTSSWKYIKVIHQLRLNTFCTSWKEKDC